MGENGAKTHGNDIEVVRNERDGHVDPQGRPRRSSRRHGKRFNASYVKEETDGPEEDDVEEADEAKGWSRVSVRSRSREE